MELPLQTQDQEAKELERQPEEVREPGQEDVHDNHQPQEDRPVTYDQTHETGARKLRICDPAEARCPQREGEQEVRYEVKEEGVHRPYHKGSDRDVQPAES